MVLITNLIVSYKCTYTDIYIYIVCKSHDTKRNMCKTKMYKKGLERKGQVRV